MSLAEIKRLFDFVAHPEAYYGDIILALSLAGSTPG